MKILVADDSSVYRALLRSTLTDWGYQVVLAAEGASARDILDSEEAPRMAILDCVMPGLTGLDLCRLIRKRTQDYVYTILLSANGEEADVIRGFELGADDYLCKPFQEFELKARLKVGERIIRAHEELVEAREALKFEATHDPLTRLLNRKAVLELLTKEISRARRLQTPLSIFLADLDFFKHINDTYGHLVGDDVLRNTAARIRGAIREYDHVGRYGGEEFIAVLPGCNADLAEQVAERVRRSISEEAVANTPCPVNITVSIGVLQWQSGMDVSDLLQETDVALYRAKNGGRNRVEVGNPKAEQISS
jgi:two-component system, cell cycle response regulator